MGKLRERLEDAYDILFNDTVLTVGTWALTLFTVCASLYYALFNSLPIIPQWAWGTIFFFMLFAGITETEDLIHYDDSEEGEEFDAEDEEIVEG